MLCRVGFGRRDTSGLPFVIKIDNTMNDVILQKSNVPSRKVSDNDTHEAAGDQ